MGFINQGSQFITFDFKHKAKGSDFNKLNRTVIRPGIYSGLKATYVGNNVFMSIGTCVFNCAYGVEDNLQVKVNFNSVYDYGIVNPTTLGQNEVLYLEYEYGEVTENYVDFKHTSYNSFDFNNKNLIIIGEVVYDGSYNISSISYTNRSFGLNSADLDYAIPDNTRYYNIEDETKFFEIDGRNLSSGTRKIVLPNFSENEGNLLISTATNTVNILNNITVSGVSQLKDTIIQGQGQINLTGTANFTSVNINNNTSVIQSNGDANFRNLTASQNMTIGGTLSIDGFLNVAETTNFYFLNIVSGTTHVANFNNSDIVFVTLQSGSASTITISIPALETGKWRNIYVYVKSNGNYSFSNTTSQGNTIFWKSTTAGVAGTQPAWSVSNTLDGHHFIFDGTRLYHVHTFPYVVTGETVPSNLNYGTNVLELFTYQAYSITPTLSGTSPFVFTAQTTLPTGVSLASNTGVLSTTSTSRVDGLSSTNYTIRATNNLNFTERIVSIRFNLSLGNLSKTSQSYTFTGLITGYGDRNGFFKRNELARRTELANYNVTFTALGSVTNEKFNASNIEAIVWGSSTITSSVGGTTGTSYSLELRVQGDQTSVNWTSFIFGNQTFLKSTSITGYSTGFDSINNKQMYPVPYTLYAWQSGPSVQNPTFTVSQYNYYQANNNLEFKIT